MGGFLVAGLVGPLVTVGLGKVTEIIIIPPGPVPPKHPKQGGSIHYKRRVKTITISAQHPLKILKYKRIDTESHVKIYNMIKEQWDVPLTFKAELEKAFNSPMGFSVHIISKSNNVVDIINRHIYKASSKIEIDISRYVKKVSNLLDIVERRVVKRGNTTEVLNIDELLDFIDMNDIADLIKSLEDAENDS